MQYRKDLRGLSTSESAYVGVSVPKAAERKENQQEKTAVPQEKRRAEGNNGGLDDGWKHDHQLEI